MINYKISIKNPSQHFIQFEFNLDVNLDSSTLLQLPTWRPGRYELGYFAKNIRRFSIMNEKGKAVKYEKVNHSQWLVDTKKQNNITVRYEYFANELNAGSTFLNDDQLYINPVNCFFYLPESGAHKYELEFKLPKNYKIASSLKKKGNNTLLANDHLELFDSPLIASESMQKKSYTVGKTKFHLVFQGLCKPNWDMIIRDFTKFTKKQIQCFGSFPVREYYYFIQTPSYRQYHGVEHEKSTVIALGPGYLLMTEKIYDDLLGVCSHELYHTWNVKNIKPKEFSPFDFSKENYNRVGYIIEGITTYMGDKMLWKSGVKDDVWFQNEMASQYMKHMWNDGRLNHSVRESSFDTWLDGYEAGVPGRKVSIYTEGALLALILDIDIQEKSKGKKSLDTVMKLFYEKYGSAEHGYEERDFWDIAEAVYGSSLKSFFNNFHDKSVSYDTKVKAALKKLKWNIEEDHTDILKSCYGIICDEKNQILKVHPDAHAKSKGVSAGNVILAVNDQAINANLNHWMTFFADDNSVKLTYEKSGNITTVSLKKSRSLYCNYVIKG